MKINKNLIASLGAGIEYYDFIIFGHLAGIISPIFFNKQPPVLSLLYSYVVFSMAYLVRPLGGLISGLLADKFGRQKTFVAIMLCMAVATFIIGVLPTAESIGILAPLILIICRLIQGMSFGAEMPSAITFITENSNQNNKFLNNSLLCSSATIGAILASLMMQVIAHKVNDLWRIPFLLGGSLAVVAFILRKSANNFTNTWHEKPLFSPIRIIYQEQKINFVLAIIFFLFSAVLVIAYVYYATYFATYFNYTLQNVYQFSTIGLVVCALLLPMFAKLFMNKNPYLVCAIVALIFACYQILVIQFNVLHFKNVILLGMFLIIHQIFIAAFNSVAYTALAELFPKNIRATSVALIYNISFVLASFLPLISGVMVFADQDILLWIMAISASTASLAAIFFYYQNT